MIFFKKKAVLTTIVATALCNEDELLPNVNELNYECDFSPYTPPGWLSEYQVGRGREHMLACLSESGPHRCGIHYCREDSALDKAVSCKAPLPEGCLVGFRPVYEYQYCDSEASGVAACLGDRPNEPFFEDYGFRGQDCTSWTLLTDVLEGTLSMVGVGEFCASLQPRSGRRLQADGRPGDADLPVEENVVHPRFVDWTNKYVTEFKNTTALYCDGRNGRKVVGYRRKGSPADQAWERASPNSAFKRSCREVEFPDNSFEYCVDGGESYICDGGRVNSTFFETFGVRGQSCSDWFVLTEYLIGNLNLTSISEQCSGARRLSVGGCQEDTTVGVEKGYCDVVAYDKFATEFQGSQVSQEHFHVHYWNTDAIRDVSWRTARHSSMHVHPGFVPCFDNYVWGSTWNRPQVCVRASQPSWSNWVEAAAPAHTCTATQANCNTKWPIMNIATWMHGSISVLKGHKTCPTWECTSAPDGTGGYDLTPSGEWCLFRVLSTDYESTTVRRSGERNICGCSMTATNYYNNPAISQANPCPQNPPS